MFGLGAATRIYVAVGPTDMRKSFEGLFGLVKERLGCSPLSGHLFLFANARRNRLKVLYWDGYGTLAIMGRRGGGWCHFSGSIPRAGAHRDSHNSAPRLFGKLERRVVVGV